MTIAFLIISGLLLLFVGGEILIRGAVALSKKIGLSPLVIGLTVVAFGTSSPELVVSVEAALDGYADIALGNVIGSNISNILLVVGASSLVYPILIANKSLRFDNLSMLLATLLLIVFCAMDAKLGPIEGAVLLLTLIGYVVYTIRESRRQDAYLPEEQTKEIEEQINIKLNLPLSLLFVVAGIGLLILGANLLISGAVDLARILGVSEAVIGVTLIAIGSSAPELATSIVAAIRKHSDIAVGNIVGSNLFNLLGILGITAMIRPVNVAEKFLAFDFWALAIATLVFAGLVFFIPKIKRWMGAILLSGYIGYILYQFV